MPQDKGQRVEISSATAQGFRQQILKSPKTLSIYQAPSSYHEEKKSFYKVNFGQTKGF